MRDTVAIDDPVQNACSCNLEFRRSLTMDNVNTWKDDNFVVRVGSSLLAHAQKRTSKVQQQEDYGKISHLSCSQKFPQKMGQVAVKVEIFLLSMLCLLQ